MKIGKIILVFIFSLIISGCVSPMVHQPFSVSNASSILSPIEVYNSYKIDGIGIGGQEGNWDFSKYFRESGCNQAAHDYSVGQAIVVGSLPLLAYFGPAIAIGTISLMSGGVAPGSESPSWAAPLALSGFASLAICSINLFLLVPYFNDKAQHEFNQYLKLKLELKSSSTTEGPALALQGKF